MRIDLNSDLGESFGPWPMGQDAPLMDSISGNALRVSEVVILSPLATVVSPA